jgi:subtilisin
MAEAKKKSVIVTFKPKDKRPEKRKDKTEIVKTEISSEVSFFTAEDLSRGVPVPSGMPEEMVGYDVNLYEAPIVMAQLTAKEIAALKKNKNIAAVEDDGHCYAVDGPYELRQMEIENQPSVQAETIPAGVHQIKAPSAWGCSRGKAIKVGICDTGIDFNHPDIKPNYKFGTTFVPTESSAMDHHGHGTHCAGTVAAAINGSGVVGVAPEAYLYAIKVLSKTGQGNWSWLIAGIDWAINKKGLNILSMSLGGRAAPNALKNMCDAAWNKGVLLVAAAGNSGPGPNTVGFPASYDSVLAVSAIDSANNIPTFSSRGPQVELCAPGVNVLSTIPGGGYGKMNGTSMACPHVSGAAALAWGAHRYADNTTIRRLLAWRSDNLGVPGRDNLFGFGRVDAEQSACEMSVPPAIPGLP